MADDIVLKTIIAEAADQGPEGMHAVASVIVNRGKSRRKTLEQIVNQPHQFTGRWRGDLDRFVERQGADVWQQARMALERAKQNPIPDIDHYMTTELFNRKPPSWVKNLDIHGQVGDHTFLKPKSKPGASLMPKQQPQSNLNPLGQQLFHLDQMMQKAGFRELQPQELIHLAQKMSRPPTGPGPLGPGGVGGPPAVAQPAVNMIDPSSGSSADAQPRNLMFRGRPGFGPNSNFQVMNPLLMERPPRPRMEVI